MFLSFLLIRIPSLTFPLFCRVGQQRRGQNVHAVLVEKAEELRLLRFLKTVQTENRPYSIKIKHRNISMGLYGETGTDVGGSQHVLGVDEGTEEAHELHGSAQLRIRVTDHLLNHQVYQQNVLNKHKHRYVISLVGRVHTST